MPTTQLYLRAEILPCDTYAYGWEHRRWQWRVVAVHPNVDTRLHIIATGRARTEDAAREKALTAFGEIHKAVNKPEPAVTVVAEAPLARLP